MAMIITGVLDHHRTRQRAANDRPAHEPSSITDTRPDCRCCRITCGRGRDIEDPRAGAGLTRERIRGRSAFLQFNQEYPGDWHLQVRRIVADGAEAAAWLDVRVGMEHQDACVWFEFSDNGLITRVVEYWPEPYEPPPGREHLVERW